jgi:hypothetical protein
VPDEAKLSFPGCDFASAISSRIFDAATLGFAVTT